MSIRKMKDAVLQKAINQLVKSIKNQTLNISSQQWAMSKDMHTLYVDIPWKLTKYQTFTNFARTELNMTYEACYSYFHPYKLLLILKYTPNQMKILSKHFTFFRLWRIFKILQGKKMPVTKLVAKYKHFSSEKIVEEVNRHGRKLSKGQIFHFELDVEHMNQLNELLKQHGMTITNARNKIGIANAMTSYLDTL